MEHKKKSGDSPISSLDELVQSSFLRGEQCYALLVAQPGGDVEVAAGDAFKAHIERWFSKTVKDEAAAVAKQNLTPSEPSLTRFPAPSQVPRTTHNTRGAMRRDSAYQNGKELITLPLMSSSRRQHRKFCNGFQPEQAGSPKPTAPKKLRRPSIPEIEEKVEAAAPAAPPSQLKVEDDLAGTELTHLHLRCPKEIEQFLRNRFHQLNQMVCKCLAKAWIKVIEPKKSSRHPYNKGEIQRPDWWPKGIQHKEPDHLSKEERSVLLLKCLDLTRSKQGMLQKFREATHESDFGAEKNEMITEIYRILEQRQRMESGQLARETVAYVRFAQKSTKKKEQKEKQVVQKEKPANKKQPQPQPQTQPQQQQQQQPQVQMVSPMTVARPMILPYPPHVLRPVTMFQTATAAPVPQSQPQQSQQPQQQQPPPPPPTAAATSQLQLQAPQLQYDVFNLNGMVAGMEPVDEYGGGVYWGASYEHSVSLDLPQDLPQDQQPQFFPRVRQSLGVRSFSPVIGIEQFQM